MTTRIPAGSILVALAALCALLAVPTLASGHGGTVRVSDRAAGPYVVSVFTEPSPLTVGVVDVSALVRLPTGEAVDGALVLVTAARPGDDAAKAVFQPATQEAATNKLYYAADIRLAEPGRWRFSVDVRGPIGQGQVEFDADVETASPFAEPALLAALIAVAVLAVTWLAWRQRGPRQAAV